MTIRRCSCCPQDAIVYYADDPRSPLCLEHASTTLCECGHTAARCPIAGCGDWKPVTPLAERLLMVDFHFIITPTTPLH